MKSVFRRLRGAIGNAVLWAASWFTASLGFWTAMHLFAGVLPMSDPWALILLLSASSGVTGFITGLAFSGYLRLAYWERSLLGIRVGPFALGGAMTAGLVTLGLSTVSQAVSGMTLGLASLVAGAVWPTLLGALTSAASIRVAQHASRQVTEANTRELEIEQEEALAMLGE